MAGVYHQRRQNGAGKPPPAATITLSADPLLQHPNPTAEICRSAQWPAAAISNLPQPPTSCHRPGIWCSPKTAGAGQGCCQNRARRQL